MVYGTDPPAIPAGLAYSVIAGPLFGDSPNQTLDIPSSNDDAQGAIGDCYLISALGAIADSDPVAIENMFIPNGVENGIARWTVRFYYQNLDGRYVADYVTVNALLPGYGGNLVYARPGEDGSFWLPLSRRPMPSGTRRAARAGTERTPTPVLPMAGCRTSMSRYLGSAATTYCPAGDPTAEQAVIAALQNHEAVTAGIWVSGDATQFNQLGLVSDHAYEIVAYCSNAASPALYTFELVNPWGFDEPTAWLTWSDLCAYSEVVVADTSGTAPLADASSQATGISAQAADAALQEGLAKSGRLGDEAWITDVASGLNSSAPDATPDARICALEIVSLPSPADIISAARMILPPYLGDSRESTCEFSAGLRK